MSSINYFEAGKVIQQQMPLVNSSIDKNHRYGIFPFFYKGKPLQKGKRWGMTFLAASSMRFRWNEQNISRNILLQEILENHGNNNDSSTKYQVVPLELIHSKTVLKVETSSETHKKQGDGIITANKNLVPVITVADCVPIYLYDPVANCFGVVHSGWKGTGIIINAITSAIENFGSRKENICIAIGPHIQECCYKIEKDRAKYFTENFGEKSISETQNMSAKEYKLSLTEANLFLLKKNGIPDENIITATDCTCCSKFTDKSFIYGSFRRQTQSLPETMSLEEKSKKMTVQAAFVI